MEPPVISFCKIDKEEARSKAWVERQMGTGNSRDKKVMEKPGEQGVQDNNLKIV